MEKYIIDTCTWIEFFHERNGVKEHVDVMDPDQICASALHYGLTVVTDNIKHFSLMPGVKCVNWVER